jgi:NitT/TauT family transport system substrate-binding protein
VKLLVVALAVILGAACAAPPSQPAAKQTLKLRIGTATTPPPALPESTLWLAKDLGYYEREGLDVDIVETQATPSVIAAMRSGDVDVGSINSEDVIRLTASKDLEMRMINSSNGRNFFMIVGKAGLTSVAELGGKSFAISRVGSQDHALSSKVLAARGVRDSVNYVSIGAPMSVRRRSSPVRSTPPRCRWPPG